MESNSRIIRFEDGTVQLWIGSKIYDVQDKEISKEFLFAKQKTGFRQQGQIKSNITVKTQKSLAKERSKIKLVAPQKDPQREKEEMEKV